MRKRVCLIAAGLLCLMLTACGGPEERPWTLEEGQTIVDSGAFSDQLEELELDVACELVYEVEGAVDGFVRRSAGATCEEVAVLLFENEQTAAQGLTALESYLLNQVEENTDYRPGEIPKLESAWLEQRGGSLLLVVANDMEAARNAVK